MPLPVLLRGNHLSSTVYEDFTTWIEVDEDSKITVSENSISLANGNVLNEDYYVYKDFGAGYFAGDFEIQFIVNVSAIADGGTFNLFLSNLFGDLYDVVSLDQQALCVIFIRSGSDYNIVLRERITGAATPSVTNADTYTGFSTSTPYYLTLTRDENVGTYGTLYLYIYSDSGRTTLVDTLSVTLSAKLDFSLLTAFSGYKTGLTAAVSAVVSNLYVPEYTASGIMPIDLSTFTEVDSQSVIAIQQIMSTVSEFHSKAQDGYIYKDYGAGYFSGDFTHTLQIRPTSTADTSVIYNWILANDIGDGNDLLAYSHLRIQLSRFDGAGNYLLKLQERYGGTTYSDILSVEWVPLDVYWMKVVRDENVGTYGTLYLYIYSDISMATLIDTLSLELHEKIDFRYLYVFAGNNNGGAAIDVSAYLGPYYIL